MKRLDVALVEWGLAPSRSKAQMLIAEGVVEIRQDDSWVVASDKNQNVQDLEVSNIRIRGDNQTLKFVSRGGLKLEAALRHLNLSVQDFRVLDVGQSTGGFTEALLNHGAREVLGLDVGHDQLHPRLQTDSRVQAIEGLHIRDADQDNRVRLWLKGGCSLVVIDVSFISLEHVFPVLERLVVKGTLVLALVKPQFEVGPRGMTEQSLNDIQGRMLRTLEKYGFSSEGYFASEVKGQDGTQEYFLLCRRR